MVRTHSFYGKRVHYYQDRWYLGDRQTVWEELMIDGFVETALFIDVDEQHRLRSATVPGDWDIGRIEVRHDYDSYM